MPEWCDFALKRDVPRVTRTDRAAKHRARL